MTYVSTESLRFRPVSVVLEEICKEHGIQKISGGSAKGWSLLSTMQRCPRSYYYRYVAPPLVDEGEVAGSGFTAREVGSAAHAFLVFHYVDFGKDVEWLHDRLMEREVDKAAVVEAFRVFGAYRYYYTNDYLEPLAGEYEVVDKRTGFSCRYDLIARIGPNEEGFAEGAWIVEHKTARAFSDETLTGWTNDGEIRGQVTLWHRAGLDKVFGPLRGVMVNILGKQKVPLFARIAVSPSSFQCDQHLKDLRFTDNERKRYHKSGYFPRRLAGCITRYGKCDFYEVCANDLGDD